MANINNVNNVSPDKRSSDFTPQSKNTEDKTSECTPVVCPTSEDSSSHVWPERLNNVRRRLFFGDTEDCCDSSVLQEKLSEAEKEEKRNKWNFDFEHEMPLEGDWVWERIPVDFPKTQDLVSSLNKTDENRTV